MTQKKSLQSQESSESLEQCSEDRSHESKWDTLLTKYVRVWVWSILFGATSGLSYAYIGVRFDRSWGPLTPLPLANPTSACPLYLSPSFYK